MKDYNADGKLDWHDYYEEALTPVQYAGGALVLAAVLLLAGRPAPRASRSMDQPAETVSRSLRFWIGRETSAGATAREPSPCTASNPETACDFKEQPAGLQAVEEIIEIFTNKRYISDYGVFPWWADMIC